jgi:hypothetical protein
VNWRMCGLIGRMLLLRLGRWEVGLRKVRIGESHMSMVLGGRYDGSSGACLMIEE